MIHLTAVPKLPLERQSVGVLELPLQQLLLNFASPLSHNSIITASDDFLADGRICLLPLYEGVSAQLPVPPIVKVGLSSRCVLHPVTYVVQEPGVAGHFRCKTRDYGSIP